MLIPQQWDLVESEILMVNPTTHCPVELVSQCFAAACYLDQITQIRHK